MKAPRFLLALIALTLIAGPAFAQLGPTPGTSIPSQKGFTAACLNTNGSVMSWKPGCGTDSNGAVPLGTSTSLTSPEINGSAGNGFYTAGAGKVDVAIGSSKVVEWTAGTETVTGALTATGDLTSNRAFVGSAQQWSIGTDGSANTSGTITSTNAISLTQTTGNGVLTVQGHQQSGGGSFVKLRDDTLGNYGYVGENAAIQGGTSYNELFITNPQASGTICLAANGGGSATANTNCDVLVDATNNVAFQQVTTGNMLCLTTTHQVGHCTASVSCTGSACTCTCTAK